MNKSVNLSVRNLVEFILRSGNIDLTYISQKRALEGTLVHQKVQKIREQESALANIIYEKEFTLKDSILYKDFTFNVDGRADGIFLTETETIIEEIKSTYRELDSIEDSKDSWHLAQAKCYAFMYLKQKNLSKIKTQLTYYNIEDEEMISFVQEFSKKELEVFFYNLLDKYYLFAKFDFERINIRNESIKKIEFPFENYRKGQRELAVAVYKTIKLEKKLFLQAPTGIGKTISTIFPTLKSIAFDKTEKIFYLTAKTITRTVAEEAFFLMSEKGLKIHVITLTAKEKICFLDKPNCNPESCIYALGHFDRINNALLDILNAENVITRDIIIKYAEKHKVCPFEFAFDITNFCDCIICDYNYVYDPKVYLKRYFTENVKNNYVLLNDESHNLVERGKEMYSASLSSKDFDFVLEKLNKSEHSIYSYIYRIKNHMLNIADILESDESIILKELNQDFLHDLFNFIKKTDKWLFENREFLDFDLILDLYFKVLDFIKISEFFDERYAFYIEENNYADVFIKLLCLDVSHNLNTISKKAISSIYFSGTLSPINYFKSVLGGDVKEDFHLLLSSPFDKNNFKLIIDKKISTKYIHRKASYKNISQRIFTFIKGKKGNYMIFFPSYVYMEEVFNTFINDYPNLNAVIQKRNLDENQREDFLKSFVSGNKDIYVAFVVLGGVFSEGIDLIGDRLIGAVIVGVGLPLISKERNVVKDYYEKIMGQGFNYAYKFPGFNKILQASGRVIRQETDRGAVLLIDSRFNTFEYKTLFPLEWQHYECISTDDELATVLNNFWEN